MTVAADATIGSTEPRHARLSATHEFGLVVQLLLEPADEEERVVGRGADDEDEQDALRLAGERDDVVDGQLVDDEETPRPGPNTALSSTANGRIGLR